MKKLCLAFCLLPLFALSCFGQEFHSYEEMISKYPNVSAMEKLAGGENREELLNLAANLFIDFLKETHWNGYSAEDGYKNTGRAFERYFSNPKWEASWSFNGTPYSTLQVIFSGIAKHNGKKAMFKARFLGEYGLKKISFTQADINGVSITPGEFLAEVYLN